jgi:hypothetical protein
MTAQALATTADAQLEVVMMSANEARDAILWMRADLEQVDASLSAFRQRALDFRDREGWRALGYGSYLDAIQQELQTELSRSYLSRLVQAAEVERDLALPIGNNVPESQLRPLAALETPDARRAAWDAANDLAGTQRRTAQHVQQAVDAQAQTCTRCSQPSASLTHYGPDTIALYPAGARLCSACINTLLRQGEREWLTQPQVDRPAPTPLESPVCACGAPATNKRSIAGVLEWRCDACAARARADDDEVRAHLEQRLRELAERAEQLGATIDYTAYDDVRYVQVVAPAGYQQQAVKCDADDLRRLVDAWSSHASAAAPTRAIVGVSALQQEHAQLLRHWKALETALYDGYRAVALKEARAIVAQLERGVV